MQLLTKDALVEAGMPLGQVQLAPDLMKAELVLGADGQPTGQVCLSAWSRDGFREWVLVEPPRHDA
jgi:hypothetical protein